MPLLQGSRWRERLSSSDLFLGQSLKNAFKTIDAAIKPQPGKPLTSLADIEPSLQEWEQSTEISFRIRGDGSKGHEAQVDEMRHLIHFASCSPTLPSELKQRLLKLEERIQAILLQETRAEYSTVTGKPLEESDVQLLLKWAEDIQEGLLQPCTTHITEPVFWMYSTLPRIFDHLTAWKDMSCSALLQSRFPRTLRAIADAPSIPDIWDVKPLRQQCQDLLRRWTGMSDVQVLSSEDKASCGLDVEVPPPSLDKQAQAPEDILHHPEEILGTLDDLKKAGDRGDSKALHDLIPKVKNWGTIEDSALSFNLYQVLVRILDKFPRGSDDAILVEISEFVDERLIGKTNRLGQSRVVGFSYRNEPSTLPPISLIFRHVDRSLYPSFRHDRRKSLWSDIIIECTLSTPLQHVLQRFMVEANSRNRHPLAPADTFRISTKEAIYSTPRKPDGTRFRINSTFLVQGSVGSVKFETDEHIFYYIHDDTVSHHSYQTYRPITKRCLPSSCIPPPNHWITPTSPTGGTWIKLNSLSFVGHGDEMHPNTDHPPIISKYIYLPEENETFKLYKWGEPKSRGRVLADLAPEKLQPPLTRAQAESLVGHTIQYEEVLDPLSVVRRGAGAAPSRKQKKAKRHHGLNLDRVFLAFVWGFDPETMNLFVFEYFERGEVSRTIMLGMTENPSPSTPINPSKDVIALERPFVVKWVGRVVLPDSDSTGAPQVSRPTKREENKPDRLSEILKMAPREFQIGIEGNHSIIVGELTLHDTGITIDNCKAGIWQSGVELPTNPGGKFLAWVQWIRDGTVDLNQPIDGFANVGNEARMLTDDLAWTPAGALGVDGGTMVIAASGIMLETSLAALFGGEEEDESPIEQLRTMAVLAADNGLIYFPGGVSAYTGSDGGFVVEKAASSDGKIIAIQVLGTSIFNQG